MAVAEVGAYEIRGTIRTLIADADYRTTGQYRFVHVEATTGNAVLNSNVADKTYGVLQNRPNTGEPASVMINGISFVSANSTVVAGDSIGSSTDGQAATIAEGTETTVYKVGTCLVAAANADELATIELNLPAGRAS
jgi:hypothetical protein